MATKKECDRCKKQWDVTKGKSIRVIDKPDQELCRVTFNIPNKPWHKGQSSVKDAEPVEVVIELCQDCARMLHRIASNKEDGADEQIGKIV